MKKALFDELTTSIRDAGAIRRNEMTASRTFEFAPEDVRAIRERLDKSQSEFARMIGVTTSTLQNWEQGRRAPRGPARALLVVASSQPRLVAEALASATRRTTSGRRTIRAKSARSASSKAQTATRPRKPSGR